MKPNVFLLLFCFLLLLIMAVVKVEADREFSVSVLSVVINDGTGESLNMKHGV